MASSAGSRAGVQGAVDGIYGGTRIRPKSSRVSGCCAGKLSMGSQGAAARRKAMREERMQQAVRVVPGLASKVQLRHLRRHQDQAQVFARYSAAGTVELRCDRGSKRLCVHLRALSSGVFMV